MGINFCGTGSIRENREHLYHTRYTVGASYCVEFGSRSFSVFEVLREEEFSPVKNAPGAAKDTPASAREDLLRVHHRWLLEAGGRVTDEQGV